MRVGVFYFPTDYGIDIRELARAAEERGFDSLLLPEHTHIPKSRRTPYPGGGELPKAYSHTHDPFVALSFAAAATTKILLGTGVCLLPQRDPIVTAKCVASLDQLSNGRFIFGIGGGWNVDEMENHGVRYETRFKLMRERIQAMKEIWTQTKPKFAGELVKFDEMMQWPKPVQKPHPPIIVGGAFPHAARRAVRYGDGWVPIAGRAPYGDVNGYLPKFKQMVTEAGRDPAALPITLFGGTEDLDLLKRYRNMGVAPGGHHPAAGAGRQDLAGARPLGGVDPQRQ